MPISFPKSVVQRGEVLPAAPGYGRIAVGDEETQLLPPYNEKTVFTPEMLIANMDWAGVDKAVLLQGPFYGECNSYVLEALNAIRIVSWAQRISIHGRRTTAKNLRTP